MHWRSAAFVTQFMQTDITPDLEKQSLWFERVHSDQTCVYWMIEFNAKAIGVINLADINLDNHSASWGFYIGDSESRNLGGLVPPYFYNFVFEHTCISSLIADVLEHNHLVLKLHKLHGYKDDGWLDESVVKNSEQYRVRRLQLFKSNWQEQKRFSRYQARFEQSSNPVFTS